MNSSLTPKRCRAWRSALALLMIVIMLACALPSTATPGVPGENPEPTGEHPSQEPHPSGEVQITFAASHTDLSSGQCTTLNWSVQGGFGVSLNNQPVERSGQKEVCPFETTTYSLDVDAGDRMERRQVVIHVGGEPALLKTQPVEPTPNPDKPNSSGCPGAPVFSNFTANPNTINAGQPSTLSWGDVTNGASGPLVASLKLEPGFGEVGSGASSRIVKPTQTTTYTLTATGCGGTATKKVTVTVNSLPVATFISVDLAVVDIYPSSTGKILARIKNNGPDAADIPSVKLTCTGVAVYNSGKKDVLYGGGTISVNLKAGQTHDYETGIARNPDINELTVNCYIEHLLTDSNQNNDGNTKQVK